ncbi:MAG: putative metal-binding motif-containing protein [Myxococcales bacterium]|nr:putative metal-binding motif-containing protein [Myxococcales bacterium]
MGGYLEVLARMPQRLLLVFLGVFLANCSLAIEARYWKPVPDAANGASDGASFDGGDGAGDVVISDPDAIAPDGCAPTACYSGPAGTEGVGACHAGTVLCGAGARVCAGEVVPLAMERCNGIDDDCNGSTDERLPTASCGVGQCRVTNAPTCVGGMPVVCTPRPPEPETCGNGLDDDCDGVADDGCECVWVSRGPGASDSNDGALTRPLFSVATAIMRAAPMRRSVCLLAPSGCSMSPGRAVFDEQVSMVNGVHVLGGFDPATRTQSPSCLTVLQLPMTSALAQTVIFPASVTMPTLLERVTVQGPSSALSATRAVEIRGGGAVLHDNLIIGGTVSNESVAVVVAAGSESRVLLLENQISGGAATRTYGVVASSPIILAGSCGRLDALGRCITGCDTGRFVRGRTPGAARSTHVVAIKLENAPGSLIDQSSICAEGGNIETFAVQVLGDAAATNVVRNRVLASGESANTTAIRFDGSCNTAGTAATVAFNSRVSTSSSVTSGASFGIHNSGANCRTDILGNLEIVGTEVAGRASATGVRCESDAQCRIADNFAITGSLPTAIAERVIGVECARGGCREVSGNGVLGGFGVTATAMRVIESDTRVMRNNIAAGCGATSALGLELVNAFARVENNSITNTSTSMCAVTANSVDTAALRVVLGSEARENEVHSNTIFADGARNCIARAVAVVRGANSSGGDRPSGVFRNNVVFASGTCMVRAAFAELGESADPRVLENNLFFAPGAAAYLDENMSSVDTERGINSLAMTTAAANLVSDPMLGAGGVPLRGSPCIDRGTATNAPMVDQRGLVRPFVVSASPGYDIGALEVRP